MRSPLQLAAALGACLAVSTSAATTAMTDLSIGTLVSCPEARASATPCLWAGDNGAVIDSRALKELLLQRFLVSFRDYDEASRNLEAHMTYIEDVHMYANKVGHAFSYNMGVGERHLMDATPRRLLPEMLVHRELNAKTRRLASAASNSSSSTSTSEFNWCSTSNTMGYSICSAVKSQQNCGSCWAFAAADSIETAVVLAANQSAAVALSPQQFLSCSTRETTQTFEYCWASSGVSGASWVNSEIKWESSNDGCNGGMTHGAFMDAAQYSWGLLTELEMPYDDSASGSSSGSNSSCSVDSSEAAASITGWSQAMGTDCTSSSDANTLLKTALANQPIAVAINSEDPFKDYSGGFYSCPNDGDLSSKDDVNHALVLVGYGTDSTNGDYWILKNSYGSSWGASGYMKLIADSKVNCGLNIFPVIPTGAAEGAAANSSVDGGGDKVFVGLSVTGWIAVAAVTTIFTIVSTSFGVLISSRKLRKLREQNSGAAYLTRTPNHGQQH